MELWKLYLLQVSYPDIGPKGVWWSCGSCFTNMGPKGAMEAEHPAGEFSEAQGCCCRGGEGWTPEPGPFMLDLWGVGLSDPPGRHLHLKCNRGSLWQLVAMQRLVFTTCLPVPRCWHLVRAAYSGAIQQRLPAMQACCEGTRGSFDCR